MSIETVVQQLRMIKNTIRQIWWDSMSDERFTKYFYKRKFKRTLDLDCPKSFHEKINWLKLYDKNPVYPTLVDKYAVREYIAKKLGSEYLIPLINVYDNADEIVFSELPESFVLKCTHGSGCNIICPDKTKLDCEEAREKLKKWLKTDYYKIGREWPYNYVPRRIVAEQYLTDETKVELKDYKLFCFNGKVRVIEVDFNRFIGHKCNVYDREWNRINGEISYLSDNSVEIKRPANLEKMIELAEKVSSDFSFLRVDFYSVYDKIYFGELTLYPGAGFETYRPFEFNMQMGEYLQIPNKK